MDGGSRLVESLTGSKRVVGTGIDESLLPAVVSARRRTNGGTWRLSCPPAVIGTLGRSLPLGTAVADCLAAGSLELRIEPEERTGPERGTEPEERTVPDRSPEPEKRIDPRRRTGPEEGTGAERHIGPTRRTTLLVDDDTVHALAGPTNVPRIVSDGDPTVVFGIKAAATEQIESSAPADVDMPSRSRLYHTAADRLGDRFAADLEAILESADYDVLRRDDCVSDLTLLVALAGRHDRLFDTIRTWAEDLNIAPAQECTPARRRLVESDLLETVKLPMGVGHPNYRLRAVEEDLIDVSPSKLPSLLRERLDH